ncbi:MAG: DUF2141 domain-containing protein [Candidatus Binataceae bacterium]
MACGYRYVHIVGARLIQLSGECRMRAGHVRKTRGVITQLSFAVAAAAMAGLLATASGALAQAAQHSIRVRVVNLRGNRGRVHCSLFDAKGNFPNSGSVRDLSVPIADGEGVCEFDGFGPGNYAAVVFQDEDSSGKFKTNWLGMPQEGYGFSNNLRPVVRAPGFRPASFEYKGGRLDLTIKLLYGP